MREDLNTKEIILQAAEIEFLEKGFAGTRTTVIAKRAGVTHSMLHYYFQTKENIFQTVLTNKIQLLTKTFSTINENENLPFNERIKFFIEKHFDFIAANPNLAIFMYSEIISNEQNRKILLETLSPIFETVLSNLASLIAREVANKTIRPIKPIDLMINIVSLNIVTFMALPFVNRFKSDFLTIDSKYFLEKRKEQNVQFILAGLRL